MKKFNWEKVEKLKRESLEAELKRREAEAEMCRMQLDLFDQDANERKLKQQQHETENRIISGLQAEA